MRFIASVKAYPLVALAVLVIVVGVAVRGIDSGTYTKWLISGYSIFIAAKLGYEMLKTLREGRYGIDILAIMAIVSTVSIGEYWASAIIVLMLTGGEALEDYAARRAKRELNALLERAPQTAHKVVGKTTQLVKLSQVRVGDVLLVKPGEVVPVDAKLLDEVAEFDESLLTGESLPVEHKRGDQLLSGWLMAAQRSQLKPLNQRKKASTSKLSN